MGGTWPAPGSPCLGACGQAASGPKGSEEPRGGVLRHQIPDPVLRQLALPGTTGYTDGQFSQGQ